jgi:hypothetical protein
MYTCWINSSSPVGLLRVADRFQTSISWSFQVAATRVLTIHHSDPGKTRNKLQVSSHKYFRQLLQWKEPLLYLLGPVSDLTRYVNVNNKTSYTLYIKRIDRETQYLLIWTYRNSHKINRFV